jgi:nitronate monooxygenase
LLSATTDDTVLTEALDLAIRLPWPDGIALRTLRNRFTDEWHGREDEIRAWSQEQSDEYRTRDLSSPDRGFAPAGECVGVVNDVEPAGEIVRRLVAETEAILRQRSHALLPER